MLYDIYVRWYFIKNMHSFLIKYYLITYIVLDCYYHGLQCILPPTIHAPLTLNLDLAMSLALAKGTLASMMQTGAQ